MFPENQKKHEMITRENEKFKVQFASTNRLQNSPIIHMQKLLNLNENKILWLDVEHEQASIMRQKIENNYATSEFLCIQSLFVNLCLHYIRGGVGGPDTNDDIDDALRGGNHQNDDVIYEWVLSDLPWNLST